MSPEAIRQTEYELFKERLQEGFSFIVGPDANFWRLQHVVKAATHQAVEGRLSSTIADFAIYHGWKLTFRALAEVWPS